MMIEAVVVEGFKYFSSRSGDLNMAVATHSDGILRPLGRLEQSIRLENFHPSKHPKNHFAPQVQQNAEFQNHVYQTPANDSSS